MTARMGPIVHDRDVVVRSGDVELAATLSIPAAPQGLVIFAHGSGSSRHSPRNQRVAAVLQRAGLATLLVDLLTADEEAIDARTGELRFDIPRLAGRLAGATDWAQAHRTLGGLPVGYFGASTGAAAALMAAAERPGIVGAVVSRGGRPDLARPVLPQVAAPTLLIVGSQDAAVLPLNKEAFEILRAATEARMDVISGATHLFEEPGALDVVADLAADWFVKHLAAAGDRPHPVGAGTDVSTGR